MGLLQAVLRHFGYELRSLPDGRQGSLGLEGLREQYERTEGMTRWEEMALLYELARGVERGCIVEVGSYRGRSTVALARGSMEGHGVPVYAVDPQETFRGVLGGEFGPEDRGAFFQTMLESGSYRIVRLVNLRSEQAARGWTQPIGLLWIDGDHTEGGVRDDWEGWSRHVIPGAPIVFDDATDPALAPHRLIAGLLAGGDFRETHQVGKCRVLQQRSPSSGR